MWLSYFFTKAQYLKFKKKKIKKINNFVAQKKKKFGFQANLKKK